MAMALATRLSEIKAPPDIGRWPKEAWDKFFFERHIIIVYHNHPKTPGHTCTALFSPDHGKPGA